MSRDPSTPDEDRGRARAGSAEGGDNTSHDPPTDRELSDQVARVVALLQKLETLHSEQQRTPAQPTDALAQLSHRPNKERAPAPIPAPKREPLTSRNGLPQWTPHGAEAGEPESRSSNKLIPSLVVGLLVLAAIPAAIFLLPTTKHGGDAISTASGGNGGEAKTSEAAALASQAQDQRERERETASRAEAEQRMNAAAETKLRLEEERRQVEEVEARRKAEEEERKAAEAEAERRAEEERRAAEAEAKRRAEEERRAAEAEAERRAEEERKAAEAEAKRRAEEERKAAEAEAKRRAEEERKAAEAEAKRRAEEERKAAEAEAKRRAEEERKAAEAEAKRKAEEEQRVAIAENAAKRDARDQQSSGTRAAAALTGSGAPASLRAGVPCTEAATVATEEIAGGRMQIAVVSPCRSGEKVTIQYGPFSFIRELDSNGRLGFTLDLFLGTSAAAHVNFADESEQSFGLSSSDLRQVTKIAVAWKGPINLDLHAFEYLARPGGRGHIWSGTPSSAENAEAEARGGRQGRGFMSSLADAGTSGDKVEVYTFWNVPEQEPGVVSTVVDYETRGDAPSGDMCGSGPLARVEFRLLLLANGRLTADERRVLAPAACGETLSKEVRFSPDTGQSLVIRK